MKLKFKTIIFSLFLAVVNGYASSYSYSNNGYSYSKKAGYEKYRVEESQAITETITKRVMAGSDIYDKVVKEKVPCSYNDKHTDEYRLDLGTVIGMGLGVMAGNQIGKGRGREVAKVVGGLTGAMFANNIRDSHENCYEERTIQVSTPRYESITQEVITGYNNCITIDGKKLCKKSKRPLKFLKIKKTYSVY